MFTLPHRAKIAKLAKKIFLLILSLAPFAALREHFFPDISRAKIAKIARLKSFPWRPLRQAYKAQFALD
jgi:hypothetical protein